MGHRVLSRLVFEGGFDARDAHESLLRGYRSHVWAELQDGSRHRLTFYDLTRLTQSLEDECSAGRRFFTEPGLVIVPEVTLANMEAAARELAREGFFDEVS
ncbi:hypothetical protein [Polyangium fumosum]|uniref:Uncharacterized protein n=1 Tax=Polyangium fumosum TaxID=889272 RepID=A0A4U1J4T4_9BACT|nr:hypothetical protein [Polyangium fumosum]TKD02247.1 hypothetical protein E8A74_29170 [Polyangium fumosum]